MHSTHAALLAHHIVAAAAAAASGAAPSLLLHAALDDPLLPRALGDRLDVPRLDLALALDALAPRRLRALAHLQLGSGLGQVRIGWVGLG